MATWDQREMELLRQARVSNEDIIRIVRDAVDRRVIVPPSVVAQPINIAGGTNFCPNSDFAFSHLAATTAGTLPGTAGATNLEVYRVYRQPVDGNIGTQRVRTVEPDGWIPLWDRVNGVISLGWDGDTAGGAENYDIAIQFTNNWLVNNRKRHVRIAVATTDDTPLPVGTKVFAGYWVKRLDTTQGWVTGDSFTLQYDAPQRGATHYKYKVVAKTDGGATIQSAELDVPDAPDAISADDYVCIKYPGASGFIEFLTYRKDVATGVVSLVAWDRQSERLHAYDTGTTIGAPMDDYPIVAVTTSRAYEEVVIDAVSIERQKTVHNLKILIPAAFDGSQIASEGTFLRIGVVGNTTANLQIVIDNIWESDSYNVWSPSPFDTYPSPPSTTITTAPPTAGGGGGGGGGSGNCVWVEHDLRLDTGKWILMGKAVGGLQLDSGAIDSPNTIYTFIEGEESHYFRVVFDCGLEILCSPSHRFARSLKDSSGILVDLLKKGDTLVGGHEDETQMLTITSIELLTLRGRLKVRCPSMTQDSMNRLYAVGDRQTGWYVYCHNLKYPEDIAPDWELFI